MIRNVIQLRWLWAGWVVWLGLDIITSITGLPWRGPKPFLDEIDGTMAVAFFLAGSSIGFRERAAISTSQRGTE